jgi:hypothetical protein
MQRPVLSCCVRIALALAATVACREVTPELPEVAQKPPGPAEMTPPPPPMIPGPIRPVVLSDSENAAIDRLAQRGALAEVMGSAERPEVHVAFPGGELVRHWRRQKARPILCRQGVQREIEPPDAGPPMTDRDLKLLESTPTFTWVDLSGTQVTQRGVARLRETLPKLKVVWESNRRASGVERDAPDGRRDGSESVPPPSERERSMEHGGRD